MPEVDQVEELLARVIQAHRVQPSTNVCSCGWEAQREQAADPMYLQYLRHGAAEQAKALRRAGLVEEAGS